jgi:hypothetical protein
MRISVGDQHEKKYCFNAQEISDFAKQVGDFNPIHHDVEFASKSRFKKPIICGPHLTALIMAISGTQLSKKNDMLGLKFNIEFKKAILSDEEMVLHWSIIEIQKKPYSTLVKSKTTVHVNEILCAVAHGLDLVYD